MFIISGKDFKLLIKFLRSEQQSHNAGHHPLQINFLNFNLSWIKANEDIKHMKLIFLAMGKDFVVVWCIAGS